MARAGPRKVRAYSRWNAFKELLSHEDLTL